jgi:UDP-glucose 4-epimerase
MKILATGGCGYIGSHIVRQLSEAGHEVIVLDNLSTGRKDFLIHGETLLEGDLENTHFVEKIIKKNNFDAVVHLAASIVVSESVKNPYEYYSNNLSNTLNLLNLCRENGIKNFLFSSTAAVYGEVDGGIVYENSPLNPQSPYGSSKAMSERIIYDFAQAYGLNYIILRYFNVAGADPLGRMGQVCKNSTHLIKVCCEAALGERKFVGIYGADYPTKDGTCLRDYIHVEDLANAHLLALEKLKEENVCDVFNVGYGDGYSVREVIQTAQLISGNNFKTIESPRREGDVEVVIANADKIQKALKWKPKFNRLEKIIQDSLNWEAKLKLIQTC